jgi:hypothetical protein
VLFAAALLSRIWAALVFPNAEQDGYSYAEIIHRLTQQFQAGQFHLSDLYGFWLPLFQVVAALLHIWIQDPIVAGKVINALCGAASIILVFAVTKDLTGSTVFSLLTFGLILLDPLHVLYSAACMTDVPHICVVLASLWCAIRRRWLAAAVFAAVAECIRIESWALVIALPMLQLIFDRRISLGSLVILVLPPVAWLGIGYIATGNPLSYFADRARYHAEYMQFHPERLGFRWDVIRGDIKYLLLGAGRLVTAGAITAAIIFLGRVLRGRQRLNSLLLAPIVFFAAMFTLLVLAYVTKTQPVLLPRYGLLFFALGLPLLAWTLQWLLARVRVRWAKALILLVLLAAWLMEINKQIPNLGKVRDDFRAHQKIAAGLVANLAQSPPDSRCFSDDVAVRVISGLPRERFLLTQNIPATARGSADDFLAYLRNERAGYLVYFPTEDSLPVKFFPELARTDARTDNNFEMIAFEQSSFGPDIWLYRLR